MNEDHKQRVLIVHNYYQIPGGEDTVVANEKRLLEEHGHEVVLYTRNNNEINAMSKPKKISLSITTVFNPVTYKDIKKIIVEQGIEIVHVHNTLNLVSPSVYYAAVKCGVPVVQTIHNFRFLCPGATFYRDGHICEDCVCKGLVCAIRHKCYRNSRLQTLICVVSTWIHRHTGILGKINFIVLTEFNREKLLQLKYIKKNQVYIKPNFSDTGSPIYGIRKNQFVYVGRLEEIKGIRFLLSAWKKQKKTAPKLILCGGGPLQKWVEQYVENNHLDNIEIRGYISHEEVMSIINQSYALILPTMVYEGFPMSIVEAYERGTPVIAPAMGNAGSLVEEGVTGLTYQPNSIDDFIKTTQKIAEVMESKDSAQHSAIIREIFKKKYSKSVNYCILKAIYAESK